MTTKAIKATGTTLIGMPISRVDGRLKVTGAAQYAAEVEAPAMAHAVLVGSAIASGRIARIDATATERAPGVLLVLTHENRGPLGQMLNALDQGGTTAEARPPLADANIRYAGQDVALVVAEQLEQAQYAASLLRVEYERAPFAVAIEDAQGTLYRPEQSLGEDLQTSRGNPAGALAAAEVRLDQTYTTPMEHPCAMEPHACVAMWRGDALTIHDSTQWVMGDAAVLQGAFGLPPEKIQVLAPFVGGMFGSKAAAGAHAILAALAAKRLARPVKCVLTREHVLTTVGHRPLTIQRVQLGAARDGALQACRHATTSTTAMEDEYVETTSLVTRLLYACPNYAASHELARLHVMKPAWMRAPGEAPGTYALECAMDELASALGMDPVALRRRNHTEVNPQTGKPFSSKHLLACYDRGAERFGWGTRPPRPGEMRDGAELVGWGMATASYPGLCLGAAVKARMVRDGEDVRAIISTAGSEVGTGMYTLLALTAAEGLGLPLDRITVELGDSHLPPCAIAGGSNLTASTAPAVADACANLRHQLAELARATVDGADDADRALAAHRFRGWIEERQPERRYTFADSRIAPCIDPAKGITCAELLARAGRDELEAEASTQPIWMENDTFAFQSFGAHFVEVRVTPDIGRVRVSRVVSVFDVGRVMNAKAARSQFLGGIVFGIGQALLEELVYDRVHGRAVNTDLAGYLVPVSADVPAIDVSWIDEPDLNFNSLGCRGLGEIGITGVAAAIANAIYHATGMRVRELPITPDKLL